MYSLDCPYYDSEFETLEQLIEDVKKTGMDPNYNVVKDGEKMGELWGYMIWGI